MNRKILTELCIEAYENKKINQIPPKAMMVDDLQKITKFKFPSNLCGISATELAPIWVRMAKDHILKKVRKRKKKS